MNIILDKCNSKNIMVAKLWIEDGSRADPIGKKGSHQLIASLMTRGCGPYNNIVIANMIEGCGALLRCDTYEDGLVGGCAGGRSCGVGWFVGWRTTTTITTITITITITITTDNS